MDIDYTKRREEMWKLRHEDGLTNTEIGRMYGISRERVRQVIGNTGRDFRKNWTKSLIKSGTVQLSHWTELGDAPGVKREWQKDWGNHRHIARSGAVAIGQQFEELASEILKDEGIENECMPMRHPYDILCKNGAKIEVVKSDFDASHCPSQIKMNYPSYAVPYRNPNCDFLFAFVPGENEETGYTYYVIPIYALSHLSLDTRIRIPHPPMSNKPSKWHKYHQRIDLIKDYGI